MRSIFHKDRTEENVDWQSTPEGTIHRLFEAAKTNDVSLLEGLCDTVGPIDQNIERLCNTTDLEEAGFIKHFINANIIEILYTGEDRAEAHLNTGSMFKTLDFVRLVRRGEKWFLYEYWAE